MSRTLVAIPVAREELAAITGQVELTDRVAHTVTQELLAECGLQPEHVEEAEYAALILASVASLLTYGARTVLIAEVDSALVSAGEQPHNGQVRVSQVPRSAMTCWFSDEPQVDAQPCAEAVRGMSLDQAWEEAALQDFIAAHDLLWHDAQEYRGSVTG